MQRATFQITSRSKWQPPYPVEDIHQHTGIPYVRIMSWLAKGHNWIGQKALERIWTKCKDAEKCAGCVINEVKKEQEQIVWKSQY